MSIQYKIIGVIVIIAALFGLHYYDRHKAVERAETALISKYEADYQKKVIDAQKASNNLLAAVIEDERVKNEALSNINAWQSATIDSLRKRPTRSQLNSAVAEARKACTGAELYREDGEFLAGEAARAEKLIKERDYYYEQYERARLALEALQGSTP